jgi:hypothetical protein
MQSVRWLTFAISGDVIQTSVHFFPSCGDVTAPYPARCKLHLFGAGNSKQSGARYSVLVDGARLSQPEGVELSNAFPFLNDGQIRLLGLEIEVSTMQPRLDLTCSRCVIELPERIGSGLILQDAFSYASLIMLNGSSSAIESDMCLQPANQDVMPPQEVGPCTLAPASVREVQLPIDKINSSKECSWGQVRIANLYDRAPAQAGVAGYIVHCDSRTNLPVSVCAL